MNNSKNIPILTLQNDNVEKEWPNLLKSIEESSFISIDILEKSSVEERYKNIGQVASTYSILSIGISCFKINSRLEIRNQTYALSSICCESFLVEPDSIRFLVKHGLDLNNHFRHAISYHRGNDKPQKSGKEKQYLRSLICEISRHRVPVVLHNGFIDLIFIYQSLYADLPESLMQFAADLSEIFNGGLFDTKYLADFHAREKASFLEYLYFKALYERKNSKMFELIFEQDLNFKLGNFEIKLDEHKLEDIKVLENKICKQFSNHGYCSQRQTDDAKCQKSHSTHNVIKLEILKKEKGKLKSLADQKDDHRRNLDDEDESIHQCHSAGLDAFMTGYAMIYFIRKFIKLEIQSDESCIDKISLCSFDGLDQFLFNIYLSGKDYPFIVKKSFFTPVSDNHQTKKVKN